MMDLTLKQTTVLTKLFFHGSRQRHREIHKRFIYDGHMTTNFTNNLKKRTQQKKKRLKHISSISYMIAPSQ